MVAKIASVSPSSLLRNRRRTIPSFQLALVLVLLLLSLYLDQVSGMYHPPNSPRKRKAQDLKVVFSNFHDLMFCRDCDDPLQEGSVVIPQKVHFNPETYFVSSVLVFAIPNDGSFALYNAHELTGKIAVFTRGKVSVVRKAQIAQNAGALAVMVIDSDTCDPETMHCHRSVGVSPNGATLNKLGAGGGGEKLGLGMFHGDPESQWLKVRIPVAMLSAADGARIRSFMDLVTVEVNGELNYLVGV